VSFAQYPEYKTSGVEWLGEVPAHWEVSRLRFNARLNPPKSEIRGLGSDKEVSFIPMDAVGENGSLQLERTRLLGDVLAGYTYFRDGDVAIAKITPCFENGKAAVMRGLRSGIGFGSTELTVLRANPAQTSARYLFLIATSKAFRSLGQSEMYGAGGQKRVPDDFIRNFAVPWPPEEEQRKIAAFLDHETAKIDALIDEQKRLIELLKEKRQAVISNAVTKGLDPDAPMKDSGVEWLGKVPAHWGIGRLRWYAAIQGGIAKGKDYEEKDTVTRPYLRVANVQDGHLNLSEIKEIAVLRQEVRRYTLRYGDVLMNEGGDNDKLGRGTVWRSEIRGCLHQNHVFAIRPGPRLMPDWLAMFTQTSPARAYFFIHSKQSTNLASISSTNVMACPLPIPSADEQRRTIDAVRRHVESIDEMIGETARSITLLQERRSALISAAVTGKIDVRDRRPRESEAGRSEDTPATESA